MTLVKTKPSAKTARSPDALVIEKSSGNIFADLGFSPAESANLSMRSTCMIAIKEWFAASGLTQASAAKQLGVTQPRLNAMLQGAINQFSLDALVNMATNAGLSAKLSLKAGKRKVA
jgi:predicted XRE-type DNA-binding protein